MVSARKIKAYQAKRRPIHLRIRELEVKMQSDKPKRSMSAYRDRQNKRRKQIDKLRTRLNKIDNDFVQKNK